MRHKIIRIMAGVISLISGAIVLIRGNLEWWNGVLLLLVGIVFLYSAFKGNKRQ